MLIQIQEQIAKFANKAMLKILMTNAQNVEMENLILGNNAIKELQIRSVVLTLVWKMEITFARESLQYAMNVETQSKKDLKPATTETLPRTMAAHKLVKLRQTINALA